MLMHTVIHSARVADNRGDACSCHFATSEIHARTVHSNLSRLIRRLPTGWQHAFAQLYPQAQAKHLAGIAFKFNDLKVIPDLSPLVHRLIHRQGRYKLHLTIDALTVLLSVRQGERNNKTYPGFSTACTELIPSLSITFQHACSHAYPHAHCELEKVRWIKAAVISTCQPSFHRIIHRRKKTPPARAGWRRHAY